MSTPTPCSDPEHRQVKRDMLIANIKNTQEYEDFSYIRTAKHLHPSRPSLPSTPRNYEEWTKRKFDAEMHRWHNKIRAWAPAYSFQKYNSHMRSKFEDQ